jgi:hypothetical protein
MAIIARRSIITEENLSTQENELWKIEQQE